MDSPSTWSPIWETLACEMPHKTSTPAPLPETCSSATALGAGAAPCGPAASRTWSYTRLAFLLFLKSITIHSDSRLPTQGSSRLAPSPPYHPIPQPASSVQDQGSPLQRAFPEAWPALSSTSALCLEPNCLWVQMLALPLTCCVTLFLSHYL